MIKAIVCCDKNYGIGKNNGLLFNLPVDLKHFKTITVNNIIVLGYNTLLSLPHSKALPNRTNIVICPPEIEPEDCIVYHDFKKLIHDLLLISKYQDIFICGGATLYKSMLPYYDEVIVTKVDASDPEATVFFPNLDELKEFEVIEESESIKDNDYNIKFVTYKRKENK